MSNLNASSSENLQSLSTTTRNIKSYGIQGTGSLLEISIRNSRYLSGMRSTCENEIIESINPKQFF